MSTDVITNLLDQYLAPSLGGFLVGYGLTAALTGPFKSIISFSVSDNVNHQGATIIQVNNVDFLHL